MTKHVFCWIAVAAGWSGSIANASDDLVHYSGGKSHSLVRSATEQSVTTLPGTGDATRARLSADPSRHVALLPWAPRATDHCIVTLDAADKSAATRLRSAAGVQSVRPVYRFAGSDSPMLSTGNLVVKLDPAMSAADRTRFFNDYRVSVVNALDPGEHVYTVRPIGGDSTDDVRSAAAMYRDSRTIFAHADFIVPVDLKQILSQFNDDFFTQQWHLNNTGQGGGTPGVDINVADAWRFTFGEDVLFGIFDDSVDVAHEDLGFNYIGIGQDTFQNEEGPFAPSPRNVFDLHGTSVLGLAAADANDVGVVGVAPAGQFTASRGLSDPVSLGQMASAFVFARQREVAVHIDSWGFVGIKNSQADVLVSAIEAAFNEGRNRRGMVVVFASGNNAEQLEFDDDLSTLPEVIGVGAVNASDKLASYSNFGLDIDVLAPSGDSFLPEMVTTDNRDDAGFANPGYNDGGSSFDQFGNPIPDLSDPSYTSHFSGTSAACPVAAGVAGLIISTNQELTASQVRTIMEHTAVKADEIEASYHPITQRSLTHGYGRIDAGACVQAAQDSRVNGGFTWPLRLKSVRITNGILNWALGDDIRQVDEDDDPETPAIPIGETTQRTLVVESGSPFNTSNAFVPTDGVPYSVGQVVASGITVVQNNNQTTYTIGTTGTRYYALFPANTVGKYAFGVTIDTNGVVVGVGASPGDTGGGGSTPPPTNNRPQVSISVTPLVGASPLEVSFRGNALSENTIASMTWTFDDGDESSQPTTTHRYTVTGSESRRFFPTFTVMDEAGNVGTRSVAVDVMGDTGAGGPGGEVGDIQIMISLPGSVNSDVDHGASPLSVELNINGSSPGRIQTVLWDLGDGTTATTVSVPHTYVNNSTTNRTFPISVTVNSMTSSGTMVSQTTTRFLTVQTDPNAPTNSNGNANANDNGSGPPTPTPRVCGAGSVTAMIGMLFLALVRRRLV